MAGLLDILDSDQGRLGVGLLAAAGPSATPMGFGQRLAQGLGYVKEQKDADLARLVKQAQLGDIQAQAALRKAQADKQSRMYDLVNQWMGGGDVKSGNDAVISQTGGLAPTNTNAQIQQGAMAKANPLMGIPPQAIMADLAANDGKGIAEWLFKRGTPDMQVNNGFAFDKNKLQPGFMPQSQVSQDGKASLIQIGADGLPVVSAPAGAFNTYAGYRNIDESAKANFDPVTVQPQGQNPQMTTRGALVRNPQVQGAAPTSAMDEERRAILNQELEQARARMNKAIADKDPTGASRAQQDMAAVSRELMGVRPKVGMPLESEPDKKRADAAAAADVKQSEQQISDASKSRDVVRQIERARHFLNPKLNGGPTASGFGSLVDQGASFIGLTTPSAEKAAALDTISGWLTANVPRMEGPQSNYDVENYKTMAGRVGDRRLPVAQRVAALDELEAMHKKYASINGPEQPKTPTSNGLPSMDAIDAEIKRRSSSSRTGAW